MAMWHSPSPPPPTPSTLCPSPSPPSPALPPLASLPPPAPRRKAGARGDQSSTPADCQSLLNLKLVVTLRRVLVGPG